MEEYRQYIKKGRRRELPPLTGDDLARTIRAAGQSSASLDGYDVRDLKCIQQWAPGLLDDVAVVYSLVERHAMWPTSMIKACITLIEKVRGQTKPLGMRPIMVLSAWYRLWGAARYAATASWQEQWVPAESYASRSKKSAVDLALKVAQDQERARAEESGQAGSAWT